LLTDELFREELGNNARTKVEQGFDINKNICALVALFEPAPEEVSAACPSVNRLGQEGARA
jgi:hypothetical protein